MLDELRYRRNLLAYPAGVAPGFDPRHIAASGIKLSAVFQGGNFVDLTTGKPAIVSGSPIIGIDGGIGPSACAPSGTINWTFPGKPAVQDTQCTMAVILSAKAYTGGQQFHFHSSSSAPDMFHLSTAFDDWRVGAHSSAVNVLNVTGSGNSGHKYFFAVSATSAGAIALVLRNLTTGKLHTATATWTPLSRSSSGTYEIGNYAAFTVPGADPIAAAMYSNRATSMAGLLQWAKDPWAFWYPRPFIPKFTGFTAPVTQSGLYVERYRNSLRYPAGTPPGFDPTHSAAKNLRFSGVASGQTFINLLRGNAATRVSSPSFVIDGAIGSAFQPLLTSDAATFAGQSTTNDPSITLAGIVRFNAITGTKVVAASSGGNNGWRLNVSSATVRITAGSVIDITSSVTLLANVPYFVVGSINGSASNFLALRLDTGQIFTSSGSGTTPTAPNGTYVIGNGPFANEPANGKIAAAMFSASFMSLHEIRQWAQDPWAFWYPTPRPKFAMRVEPPTPGSPWLPSALATRKLWLRADTIAGTTGDPISTWTDESGFGAHATQTGSARPTLQTAHQNGLNVIRFNKANTGGFVLPNVFTGFTEGAVAFVGRLVTDPGTAGSGDHGPLYLGAHTDQNHYPYGGDNQIYDNFGSTTRKVVGNPTPSLANYHIGGFRSKASDWSYFLNGTQFYNTTTNTVGFTSNPRIGRHYVGTNYFDGYLAEIVMLNEFASTEDWQKVEGYLAWKWGLVADLDASHPYKTAAPVTPGGVLGAVYLDPTQLGTNIVLSNLNLTATQMAAATANTRAIAHHASGKYYCEFTVDVSGDMQVGICNAVMPLTEYLGEDNTHSIGVDDGGGGWVGAGGTTTAPGLINGHTYGLAIDITSKKAWIKDITAGGLWNSDASANPVTGVNGATFTTIT